VDNLKRLKICLLLHFYQPWWQFPWILKQIVNECYRPILRLVEESDDFCFTININLVLLQHLENDYPDVVAGIKKAVESGKLELVSSTAHHPIIPLIPENVQRVQIEEDTRQKKEHFGISPNCKGIFLPEMAFSTKDIKLLKSYGLDWTVIDDEPVVATGGKGAVPYNQIVSYDGFKVFMRSNRWSNLISDGRHSFEQIRSMMELEIPGWTGNAPSHLEIAMDAETFGHHHKHLIESFLRPMLKEWTGKIVPIGSLLQDFPEIKVQFLPDGSWSTSTEDIRRDNPYPLWSSKISVNRYRLWRLVNLALKYFEQAREDCLKMTSSCHWWQISRSGWEPEFMQKGATLAMNVIKQYGTQEEVASIQKDYEELMQLIKVFVYND
jgi:hypothetical protein